MSFNNANTRGPKMHYIVKINTQSFPMFVSIIKSIKGRELPKFTFHDQATRFDDKASAEKLANQVKGFVIEVQS